MPTDRSNLIRVNLFLCIFVFNINSYSFFCSVFPIFFLIYFFDLFFEFNFESRLAFADIKEYGVPFETLRVQVPCSCP